MEVRYSRLKIQFHTYKIVDLISETQCIWVIYLALSAEEVPLARHSSRRMGSKLRALLDQQIDRCPVGKAKLEWSLLVK